MTKLKNIVIAVASLVMFTGITNAQAVKAGYSVNADEPLKVKYLGDDGEYLLFEVTSLSNDSSKSRFVIDDKIEGRLYASVLPANLKVTTIKIEKREDDQVLNFKLVSGKKSYIKSFSVNTTLVETTSVVARDLTKL